MTERDTLRASAALRLALDTYEARLDADAHLPEDQRRKLARAAAMRVIESGAPAAMAWIEKQRPRTTHDELQRPRLLPKARPHIDAVLREANASGDVSERMLLKSRIPWVIPFRDRLCWLLSREEAMTMEQVGVALEMPTRTVQSAIRRHVGRMAGELAASERKEASHG